MSLFGEADGWDSCYQGFGYAGSCSGCPYAANCPHEQQDDTGGHLIASMADVFDDLLDSDDTYKQFGNAVTVSVAEAVAKAARVTLEQLGEWR